jgi:hypothetical protein
VPSFNFYEVPASVSINNRKLSDASLILARGKTILLIESSPLIHGFGIIGRNILPPQAGLKIWTKVVL